MMATVDEAVASIRSWGEAREWRGYDPYDGLNSPAAPLLSLGTAVGRRVVTQTVKLSPLNLRPLLGIRRAWNAKAVGLVASAYARLAAATGDESARVSALSWLDWLAANTAPGEQGAWGYHFPVQTRVFAYERGTPNTIATCFVAHAFLDAAELLGDERPDVLRGTTDYLRRMLVRSGDEVWFRYLPGATELVHNASLLACGVLARANERLRQDSLPAGLEAVVATTLAAQRPDGSWPYAAGVGHGWVDNFHTGYVLESLALCGSALPSVREPLARGVEYWARELFLADGTPKYTPASLYPLDAHCYAQAIETWLAVAELRADALERAERVASLLVRDFLHPDGHVRFQRRRLWANDVPFVRWTTAPAFRALARLLAVRAGVGAAAVPAPARETP